MSLQDHVEAQFRMGVEDPADRMIGFTLIDSIDDAGYLLEPLEDIAERLSVPIERVEMVLQRVQACDPTGVGARNLAECLKLQLIERGRFDPAMGLLLDNLALLARRDFVTLRRICNVDEDDMAEMVGEIRNLDPKPGLRFGGARCAGAARTRQHMAGRTQHRYSAQSAGQPDLCDAGFGVDPQ